MNASLAAFTDPTPVDLSKPSIPQLTSTVAVAVGDEIRLMYNGPTCALLFGLTGYGCARPHGHDRSVTPCVAARFVRAGDVWEDDVFRVEAIGELYVPLTEAQVIRLQAELADAKRKTESATDTIERIREYVIAKMHEGAICPDGTRDFLEHFGLPLWERDFRITVELTLSVNGTDEDSIRDDVEATIRSSTAEGSPFPYILADITVADVDEDD